MNVSKTVSGITFDAESVDGFIRLLEKESWSEEDVHAFVSTKGVQYLIQQEKEFGPNSSEDAAKTFLDHVKRGDSGDFGGWAAAWKERTRTRKRLDHFLKRWNYMVVRPLSVVKEYLPENVTGEGTCYFLPGGSRESYADSSGFALNLGHGPKKDVHWIFLIAREAHYFWSAHMWGDLSITGCTTLSEFIEAFLDLTHRKGIATLAGLRAAGIEEQFFQEHPVTSDIMDAYSEAFNLALEEKAKSEASRIYEEVFSGYASPAALIGAAIAKRILECEREAIPHFANTMLLSTITKRGFFLFFEIYRGCDTNLSLLPDAAWEAYEKVRKERNLTTVREGAIYFG